MFKNRMMKKKSEKNPSFSTLFLSFLSRGMSRDGTGQAVKIPSRPVPWQNFELVPLSLCPGTRKKLLSRCPEKLRCPVPLETLIGAHVFEKGKIYKPTWTKIGLRPIFVLRWNNKFYNSFFIF